MFQYKNNQNIYYNKEPFEAATSLADANSNID